MKIVNIILVIFLFSLNACSTDKSAKNDNSKLSNENQSNSNSNCQKRFSIDTDNHLLIVDRKGDVDNGDNFSEQFRKIMINFVKFRKIFQKDCPRKNKILIYVNGGLNTEKIVRKQASEQIPLMIEDGYFPIFLIWRTGAFETYGEQVLYVRNGILKNNVQATAPFNILADLVKGIAQAPVTYYNQGGRFGDSAYFQPKEEYSVLTYEPKYSPEKPVSRNNNVLIEDGVSDNVPRDYFDDALYAVTSPIRLISTPFTDSFGKTAWENMVRRARTAVKKPIEFQPELGDPIINAQISQDLKRYPNGTGAFSKFFQELQWCANEDQECGKVLIKPDKKKDKFNDDEKKDLFKFLKDSRLTIMGHSMGAIALNELFSIYKKIPYENIIYMAAACSFRDTLNSMIPLLENSEKPIRFYNLMLHPLADAREVTAKGIIPSGSLLEWIDDMYEHPKTIIDRTLGKFRNVRIAKHVFPKEAQKKMIFKVFGFRKSDPKNPEKKGDPVKHGHFNDTSLDFWQPHFWGENAVNWELNEVSPSE